MIRQIGKVDGFEIIECIGWDAVRGVIGREEILREKILVFVDCPMIHSFLVRDCFWATWLDRNFSKLGEEKILPNSFSGFYKFRAICLESLYKIDDILLAKIVEVFTNKL